MNWEVVDAKNGEKTLLLNSNAIYSLYNPTNSIKRWIDAQINQEAETYLLIGLGLGYHLQQLNEAVINKKIYVYYFEKNELNIFEQHGAQISSNRNKIEFVNKSIPDVQNMQILIPDTWLKAINADHPLYLFLEDIKIKQNSINKFEPLLLENFNENVNQPFCLSYPKYTGKIACLVSGGPSLNETLDWLKAVKREKIVIFCVATASKKLISENIIPDVIVVSDPQKFVINHIGENHEPDLYYLSTVYSEIPKTYRGRSYMLFQNGFEPAEKLATQYGTPLIEVGGSVATVTFSLIEMLGFKKVILFGQDLGFAGDYTHAEGMSSYRKKVSDNESLYEIPANSGEVIKTTKTLMTYLRWFNQKIPNSSLKTFNTSWNGAKINGSSYISKNNFILMVNETM